MSIHRFLHSSLCCLNTNTVITRQLIQTVRMLEAEWWQVCREAWVQGQRKMSQVRGGADKSLAQPTSRCHRTELIVSERGVCSCAELQVFLLQRLKVSMSGEARFHQHGDASCHQVFFFPLQDKVPKEIHAILTKTLGEHAPSYATVKTGWPSLNTVIFPPVMRLVLEDPKQWPSQRLLIKFMS